MLSIPITARLPTKTVWALTGASTRSFTKEKPSSWISHDWNVLELVALRHARLSQSSAHITN